MTNASGGKAMVVWIIILCILSIILFIDNNFFEVVNYEIKSKKIPHEFDDFKILQLTDLHSKKFGKHNSRLVRKIEDINPNIIVITGDMIKDDGHYRVFFELIKKIYDKYKIYFIVGNHEQKLQGSNLQMYNDMLRMLNKFNVNIIENGKEEIVYNGEKINLYGMKFDLKYYRNVLKRDSRKIKLKLEDIESRLGKCEEDKYNILMIHNPVFFMVYAAWGADLVLCGHMHGGMVRIPFIGGIFSPEHNFFPKYCSGKYDFHGKKMIISRGLGIGDFGFRFLNRPEIAVIKLKH